MTAVDPIVLELINCKFTGIVDEMRMALFHSGYSTVLRESEDGTVGLLDASVRTIGVSKKLPLHFSSFEGIGEHLPRYYKPEELEEGDVILYNSPFTGLPTHSYDVATLVPVFVDGTVVAYTASLAHKPDLGGRPDFRTTSRDMWETGLIIPPIKFYERGTINPEIERLVAANSRRPREVMGDLRAQVAACRVGAKRVQELCARFGANTVARAGQELIDRVATRLREEISKLPDDTRMAEAFWMTSSGRRLRVHLKVTKQGDEILFDFTDSDDEVPEGVNATSLVIKNTCYFGLMAFTDPNLPFNHGFVEVAKTRFREGTIVCPAYGGTTAGYVGLTYFVSNVVLKALGEFWPEKAIAGSGGGGGGNIRGLASGSDKAWELGELLDTALGATGTSDGISLIHGTMGMGQFRPGPIEIHETEFPVRITRFDVRLDSGGPGKFRGGLGGVREYQVLEEAQHPAVRGVSRRQRQNPPWGIFGGQPGRDGALCVNGMEVTEAMRHDGTLKPGDVQTVETAGGGGYGDPLERDPSLVRDDVLERYVSIKGARHDYGVVISEDTLELDLAATAELRRKKREETQQPS